MKNPAGRQADAWQARARAQAIRVALWVVVASFGAQRGEAAEAPPVPQVTITPQGEVGIVRQVVARFSQPMARSPGDDVSGPVTLRCDGDALSGNEDGFHWSDRQTFVIDLDHPLAPHASCVVTLRPGLRSEAGALLPSIAPVALRTSGPAIQRVLPAPGDRVTIVEHQAFALLMNGPVTNGAIVARTHCEVTAAGATLSDPVVAVPDAERAVLAKALGFEPHPDRVAVFTCARPFPPAAHVRLVFAPEKPAAAGAAAAEPAHIDYVVRSGLSVAFGPDCGTPWQRTLRRGGLRCDEQARRIDARADVHVEFSRPVPMAQALRVRLRGAGGERAPRPGDLHVVDGGASLPDVTSIVFDGPFQAGDSLVALVPADLVDRDGARRADSGLPLLPVTVVGGLGNDVEAVTLDTGAFAVRGRAAALDVDVDAHASVHLREARVLRVPAETPAAQGFDDTALMRWVDLGQRYLPDSIMRRDGVAQDLGDAVAHRSPSLFGAPNAAAAEQVVATSAVSLLDDQPSAVTRALAPRDSSATDRRHAALALAGPGLHVVEVAYDAPDGDEAVGVAHARSVVLVTDLSVHLVRVSDGMLAWVTSLSTGQPVAGAAVQMSDCGGHRLGAGVTDGQGTLWMPAPAIADADAACADAQRSHLPYDRFVSARRPIGDGRQDIAFTWMSWSEGYGAYGGPPVRDSAGFASSELSSFAGRRLLAPGQTLTMKHWLRVRSGGNFEVPPRAAWPTQAIITDPAGEETVVPLTWGDRADAQWQWVVPASARRGYYQVALVLGGRRVGATGFQVRDFRVPEVDASVAAVDAPWHAGDAGTLEVSARYFNGGPAVGMQVELDSALMVSGPDGTPYFQLPMLDAFPGFSVDRGPGWRHDVDRWEAAGGSFDADLESLARIDPAGPKPVSPHQGALVDATGHVRFDVPTGRDAQVAQLQASLRFTDPDGEVRRIPIQLPVWPSMRRIGVKLDREEGGVRVDVVVTDLKGHPIRGARVVLDVGVMDSMRERRSFNDGLDVVHVHDAWRTLALPADCELVTSDAGLAGCHVKALIGDHVQAVASVADESGAVAASHAETFEGYVQSPYGRSGLSGVRWYANPRGGERPRLQPLELQADAGFHRIGESAGVKVLGRFEHQLAMLLVVADGLIERRNVVLDGVDPYFSWTIDRRWLPEAKVNVVALELGSFDYGQGRIGTMPAPVQRSGQAALRVDVTPLRLTVVVKADAEQVRPGETAQVRVRVTRADGRPAPAGTRVALAVVDDALSALLPNDMHELEKSIERAHGGWIATAGLQFRPELRPSRDLPATVMGDSRVRFSAAAASADAVQRVEVTGSSIHRVETAARLRSVFDTALAWLPAVALDADGTATIPVLTNDSLAHWRVVAIADGSSPDEALLVGSGETTFDTRQPLQLTAGLPRVVHTGDRYQATLAIRNDSDAPADVQVSARAGQVELGVRGASVAAHGRADVTWDAVSPDAAGELAWQFAASAGTLGDRVEFRQQVVDRVPVTVRQATLVQVSGTLDLALQPPGGTRADLTLKALPSLGADLPGVADFFRRYRYRCLEQRVSLAVGQRDAKAWQGIAGDLASYLDDDALPMWFPPRSDAQELLQTGRGADGSDELAAYVVAIAAQARRQGLPFELPQASGGHLVDALTQVALGTLRRERGTLATRTTTQKTLRRLAAIAALARAGAAQPSMMAGLGIDLDGPTSALLDLREIVADLPGVPDRDALRARIDAALRARLDERGSRIALVERPGDRAGGLMSHPDVDALRLALLAVDDPAWKALAPRLVAGALARQHQGHWATTVANAWGTLLMADFAQRFETQPVSGTTLASVAGAAPRAIVDWQATPAGAALKLPRGPSGNATLRLEQRGTGAPWVSVLESAAVAVTRPANHGFAIRKTITPLTPHPGAALQRGDIVRVHLDIEAAADATWVVVDDPLPAGAAITSDGGVGRDPLMRGAWRPNPTLLAYVDQRFDRFQAFFSRVGAGHFSVDYAMRLDTAGRLGLPATRVEAMYAPEMFGEWPNATIAVGAR